MVCYTPQDGILSTITWYTIQENMVYYPLAHSMLPKDYGITSTEYGIPFTQHGILSTRTWYTIR